MTDYELIVVGASWGGLHAVGTLLDTLPEQLNLPLAIVQHRGARDGRSELAELLQSRIVRPLLEAGDKQPIERRHVYLAPPDYHLLVERGHFALSTDARVSFARPSVDVLFESAADAYGPAAIGIILTGANDDGARGLARIKEAGGVAIVQDPNTAERRAMPDAAIAATSADVVLPLEEISPFLRGLCLGYPNAARGASPSLTRSGKEGP